MPSFFPGYLEPGTYVKSKIVSPPVPALGQFIPAIIGTGKPTKSVTVDLVRQSSTENDFFTLSPAALTPLFYNVSLVVDEYQIIYEQTISISDTKDFHTEVSVTSTSISAGTLDFVNGSKTVNASADVSAEVSVGDIITDSAHSAIAKVAAIDGTGKIITLETEWSGYTVTNDDAEIVSTISGVKIVWESGKGPEVGKAYQVTYVQDKVDSDFEPQLILSKSELFNLYGTPDAVNGSINYTLPAGGELVFLNGGGGLYAVQVKDETQPEFEAALDKLKAIEDSYIVVPMITSALGYTSNEIDFSFFTTVKNHVLQMSSITEKKYRIAILGASNGVDDETNPETYYRNSAKSLNSNRVVYVYPAAVKRTYTSGEITLNGAYVAAAVAGIVSNPSPAVSISGQSIAGLTLNSKLLRLQLNQMASDGVLIVTNDLSIRHALTTDPSSVLTAELRATKAADAVVSTLENTLTRQYVNTRFTAGTLSSIAASVRLLLRQALTAGTIFGYRDLSVTRNDTDPRQIDVKVAIQPSLDITYIYVELTITV